MSLSATYDQTNAVVELTVDGLATAGAAIATIERSDDNATWTPVRGAVSFPVTGDGPDVYLDYEFTPGPGVTNYYRVVEQDGPEFIAVGTADSEQANGMTLTPGLPVGTQPDDILVLYVGVSTPTGAHGINDPAGWTLLGKSPGYLGSDDLPMRTAIYAKVAVAGESTPSVTISGAIASSCAGIAQVAAFRNLRPVMLGANEAQEGDQPASTTQVEFPALAVVEDFALALAFGASAVAWTSAAAPSPFTLIDDPLINNSDDASLAWAYDVRAAAGTVASDVFTITGGSHPASSKRGWTVALSYDSTNAPTSVLFTDDVDTPLDEVWLKDPLRPARNMVVEVASPVGVRHASRSALFDIKGRAEPIEVSEIRRTRAWTQRWIVRTFTELDGLLELFAPGRTLLLQVPARGTVPECPPWPRNLPGGYISVGDVAEETAVDAALPATLTAPVQIVAAPCADLAICEPVEDSP
jgi:hypothetical protein